MEVRCFLIAFCDIVENTAYRNNSHQLCSSPRDRGCGLPAVQPCAECVRSRTVECCPQDIWQSPGGGQPQPGPTDKERPF